MNALRLNLKQLSFSAAILFACSALPSAQVKADTQGGYSHDEGRKTTNPDWMSRLTDTRLVSWLALPGTHDTMAALTGVGRDNIQTQTMSLSNQLESGIRALDILCRRATAKIFYVVHGIISLDFIFDDVLNDVTAFLKAHPREAIFLRLKQEDPINKGSAEEFEQIFVNYLQNPKYNQYFWTPPQPGPNPNSSDLTLGQIKGSDYWATPTDLRIGAVRGKIVILQDFISTGKTPVQYGISWNSLEIQDNWNLSSNAALYDTWLAVKDRLKLVNGTTDRIFYANFLSGNGGSFPYFVASGKSSAQTGAPQLWTGLTTPFGRGKDVYPDFPRRACFFDDCSIDYMGTNELTSQWLKANHSGLRRGQIIFADFPGPDLITNTINFNPQ